MKLLGTGLSGLVGSRIVEVLSPRHTFTNMSLENGVDITDRDDVISRVTGEPDVSWVLHFAAYTNVQQAETDRHLGTKSDAWKVNVEATQSIIDACIASGKKLVYVDTDYAFDGTKQVYKEDDASHPQGWYAETKSEGAKRVVALGKMGLVIRISNPYRANPVGKTDFVHKMLLRLQTGQDVVAPYDQLFVPTYIDDIAIALEKLITIAASGIYHVVGSQAISPFDAAKVVAKAYGYDARLVKSTTFREYFAGRAPIPQYAVLSNEKLRSIGISMRGFLEGIQEVKRIENLE